MDVTGKHGQKNKERRYAKERMEISGRKRPGEFIPVVLDTGSRLCVVICLLGESWITVSFCDLSAFRGSLRNLSLRSLNGDFIVSSEKSIFIFQNN